MQLVFEGPTPFWAGAFCSNAGIVLPRHIFEPYRGHRFGEAPANLKPVGTGPYRYVDFKPGDSLRAELNPGYHMPNHPFFETLDLKGGARPTCHARVGWSMTMRQDTRETSMPFTSGDIYPLAQRLHAQLPHKAWPRDIGEWEEYTHVADALRAICRQAEVEEPHGTIIAEALAGLIYHWGSRYRRLDAEIAKATDVLVMALGGTLRAPGMYALQGGTPITIAAIAHLVGWVTILEVEES